MKKEELIKIYEDTRFAIVSVSSVLEDLKQLEDEKEKVTLPRPVANWISCVRGQNKTLHFALENAPEEVNLWFCENEKNRQNIFADAWVNGYHIERAKRYLVKAKGMDADFVVLKLDKIRDSWYLGNDTEYSYTKVKHTRKELEQAGFGWVFDCPGMEVEEVKG